MVKAIPKASEGFEPPKYLTNLIAAVNDGGKAAQAGALLFALVGVYLAATAFSASDEDLLRGTAVTISQVGASLPVSFSFAIAPFVFVFLHIYTLARYDMLAANVRQFQTELHRSLQLEIDRERCRQLLANVEFIQALVAPRGSPLYSPVWRWLVRIVLAFLPVLVLLLVQINALRYQGQLITWVQRFGLLLDLSALVWFFHRNPLNGSLPERAAEGAHLRRWAGLLVLPVLVMGLNLVYLNVVPADADIDLVRYSGWPLGTSDEALLPTIWQYAKHMVKQPLDVALCPSLSWGCRYFRLNDRTLVYHVWDDKAIVDLRSVGIDQQTSLAAIEGLVLRRRSLRFAVFDRSSLFRADLTGADMQKATLEGARLRGAYLFQAQLQSADLVGAQLQGAELANAQLHGADLTRARMQGADLTEARLQRADLSGAQLQGTDLTLAQLQVAELGGAELQGANLSGAQLQGTDLSLAQLQGATLRFAALHNTIWSRNIFPRIEPDLELSDLRGGHVTPLTADEIKSLHAALDAITEGGRKSAMRFNPLPGLGIYSIEPQFKAGADHQVLVDNPADPIFKNIPNNWLIATPTPSYVSALTTLLVDHLARADPDVAAGLARRIYINPYRSLEEDPLVYGPIACRLIENAASGKVKLDPRASDALRKAVRDQRVDCDGSKLTSGP